MEPISLALAFVLATILFAPGIAWTSVRRLVLGVREEADYSPFRWLQISVALLPATVACLVLVRGDEALLRIVTGGLSQHQLLEAFMQLAIPLYFAVFVPPALAFAFLVGKHGRRLIDALRQRVLHGEGVTLKSVLSAFRKPKP